MKPLVKSTALALSLLATTAHAGSLSVSNSKGFATNPVVDPNGTLLTNSDPVLVAIGTFASVPTSALPNSQETVSRPAYADLLAGFTPYGNPVVLVQPAAPLNLRGVFSFQGNERVKGTPLAGKPVYAVVVRGASLGTASQVAVLKVNAQFESADDDSPFPKLAGMGTALGTVTIIGSENRFTAAATSLDVTPHAAYSLAVITETDPNVPPAAVTTGTASGITWKTATLSGTVNPNGLTTAAQIEYGLTTAYGSAASVTLSPDNGSAIQNVSANLGGLQAATTYHYRLTATNGGGTTPGADMTFATYPTVPYDYTTTNGKVTINGYTGSGSDVVIPASINGLPVSAIGDLAFHDRADLTSVTIPNSVTSIGTYAFYNCIHLAGVGIPDSVTSIGPGAFAYCLRLLPWPGERHLGQWRGQYRRVRVLVLQRPCRCHAGCQRHQPR